jgi:hypothetical protein
MSLTRAAVDASKSLTASDIPKEIEGVGITEKLGQKIDLNLPVIDETGNKKPWVLSLMARHLSS